MPRRIGCTMRNAMSAASQRYPRRPLRARAADQGRRGAAEGSEAAPADVRDGDHRALSAARELGRRGADRDVSGGGIGASKAASAQVLEELAAARRVLLAPWCQVQHHLMTVRQHAPAASTASRAYIS